MEVNKYYSEIENRFGKITRARGPFLYTEKNVRLTDLFQEGGRAILGWDSVAYTVFKNVISKGLSGSFTTAFRAQLKKAVSVLLGSDREVFYFTKKSEVMNAAIQLDAQSICHYKPFVKEADYKAVKNIIIMPPLPWTNNFFILAVKENGKNCHCGEIIPPALEAGAARAIYDLIAETKRRSEKDFFLYDTVLTKYWKRTGPYLEPKVAEKNYDDFVLHCLECAIIISPDYNVNSIIPFGADKGVFKKLNGNPYDAN